MEYITSLQNPLVKHLVKLRQNRDYRYDHHCVFVEGIKPISEINKSMPIKTLVASDERLISDIKAEEIFIVNEAVMKKISGMKTPEGLVAEIPMPPSKDFRDFKYLVAFDGINDPGNFGTLLRTALALGWEGAFILEESCDPYNEKALRAARGATFRLPLAFGTWKDLANIVENNLLTPLVGDLHGEKINDISISHGVLLVLGNEARGVSEHAKNLCKPITISMPGDMESLNVAVAGGIMMYELKKDSYR